LLEKTTPAFKRLLPCACPRTRAIDPLADAGTSASTGRMAKQGMRAGVG
jgi:hypothetical protein